MWLGCQVVRYAENKSRDGKSRLVAVYCAFSWKKGIVLVHIRSQASCAMYILIIRKGGVLHLKDSFPAQGVENHAGV